MPNTEKYTIAEKDTFYSLSRKLGTTVEVLQALNPKVDYTKLVPGVTEINIPSKQAGKDAPDTASSAPVRQAKRSITADEATQTPVLVKPNIKREALEAAREAAQPLYIKTEGAPGNKGKVFLTFDDGPVPGRTDKVLDALKGTEHKATFFVIGENVVKSDKHRALIKRMHDEGHEIAVHSWDHTFYTKQTSSEIKKDSVRCAEEIFKITGERPEFSRPPGGWQSVRAKEALAELGSGGVIGVDDKTGYTAVFWDVDTEDTTGITGKQIVENLRKDSEDGSIILAHDLQKKTCAVVPEMLKALDSKGLRSYKLSDSANLDGEVLNPMSVIGNNAKGLENLSNKSGAEVQTAAKDDAVTRG